MKTIKPVVISSPPLRTLAWFYRSPEERAHEIAELVRQTLWDAHFYNFWLDTKQAHPPFLLTGTAVGKPARLSWQPATWLRWQDHDSLSPLTPVFSYLLGIKPAFSYLDPDGFTNWEWWVTDSQHRWQEISGNPMYQQVHQYSR